MKIGIDAVYLQNTHYQAGLYQYTYQLIRELQEVDQENDYVLFFFNWRSLESDRIINGYSFNKNIQKRICRLPYQFLSALSKIRFPINRILGEVDLFHGPTFRLVPSGFYKKSVVTIHDLKFNHPEFFPDAGGREVFRWHTIDAIKRADLHVAVSEFTRTELLETFRLSPERVRVIYPGIGREFTPNQAPQKIAELKKKYDIRNRYILFVGFMEEKKNLLRLVQAFSQVRKLLQESYQLVLIGPTGPVTEEVIREIQRLSLGSEVILTGHVPPEELPLFYTGAALFVFPSLYEGFGIPPLEAMASGTPVVASNVTALSEVVGSAGILVDPFKTEEITHAICTVLIDRTLHAVLRQRGLERSKRFSWNRMAREMLALYKEL